MGRQFSRRLGNIGMRGAGLLEAKADRDWEARRSVDGTAVILETAFSAQ